MLRGNLETVGMTLTEEPEKKNFIWDARKIVESEMSKCGTGYPSGDTGVYTFCFGLYFGNLGYSGGRAIIMLWTLTVRDAPAGGLFIFF